MSDDRAGARANAQAEMLRARQTARGLLTHAKEFHAAASLIADAVGYDDLTNGLADSRYHNPFYYLCGHSLELAMKSALLIRSNHERLKELGHRLTACLTCMKTEYPAYQSQYDEHRAVIELLDISYSAKEFEYRMTGFARWPVPSVLLHVTEDFSLLSEEICKANKI